MVASGDGAYSLERGDTRVVFSTAVYEYCVCGCTVRGSCRARYIGVVWRYCLTVSQPCVRAVLRVRETETRERGHKHLGSSKDSSRRVCLLRRVMTDNVPR